MKLRAIDIYRASYLQATLRYVLTDVERRIKLDEVNNQQSRSRCREQYRQVHPRTGYEVIGSVVISRCSSDEV